MEKKDVGLDEERYSGMGEKKQGCPGSDCMVPVLTDVKYMGVH